MEKNISLAYKGIYHVGAKTKYKRENRTKVVGIRKMSYISRNLKDHLFSLTRKLIISSLIRV